MNILLIDGNTDSRINKLEKYLNGLVNLLINNNHSVKHIKLRDKKINYCTGCWSCWVKTPGKCFVSDDSHDICYDFIHSDFVLFASPIIMGFTSALLKRLQDKLIPLVHPYIEIVQNECHHKKRYESYPNLGLLLDKSPNSDDEDVEIIENIYKRFSLNLKSELCFTKITNHNIEDVVHAINTI